MRPATPSSVQQFIDANIGNQFGVSMGAIYRSMARTDAVGRMSKKDLAAIDAVAATYLYDHNGNLITADQAERYATDAKLMRDSREQRQREERSGFAVNSPEMAIGEVTWEFHTPHRIHRVDGARGQSPRWVRLLAAREWPDANGIQVVRVRVECANRSDFGDVVAGVQKIMLDLSPTRMGIDATSIGNANSWSS